MIHNKDRLIIFFIVIKFSMTFHNSIQNFMTFQAWKAKKQNSMTFQVFQDPHIMNPVLVLLSLCTLVTHVDWNCIGAILFNGQNSDQFIINLFLIPASSCASVTSIEGCSV